MVLFVLLQVLFLRSRVSEISETATLPAWRFYLLKINNNMHVRAFVYATFSFVITLALTYVFRSGSQQESSCVKQVIVFDGFVFLKLFLGIFCSNIFITLVFYVIGFYKKNWIAILFAMWNMFFIIVAFSRAYSSILELSSVCKMLYVLYAFIEILCYAYAYCLSFERCRSLLLAIPVYLLVFAGMVEAALPWLIANV